MVSCSGHALIDSHGRGDVTGFPWFRTSAVNFPQASWTHFHYGSSRVVWCAFVLLVASRLLAPCVGFAQSYTQRVVLIVPCVRSEVITDLSLALVDLFPCSVLLGLCFYLCSFSKFSV